MRDYFNTTLLFKTCMDQLQYGDSKACNTPGKLDEYYDLICHTDIIAFLFSFTWIISITLLQISLGVLSKLSAHAEGQQIQWFQNFKKSIFYQIPREGEAPKGIWKSQAFQYFLYFTISLGYYYWIPIENVAESFILKASENGNKSISSYIFAGLVGLICEFFYFWITFFIILMLGTRWEYTIYNRVEHVSSNDKTSMLIFMLKKSVVMSSLFLAARLLLLMLFQEPMISTYNHPIANLTSFRLYRIFRSVFIFIYGWQRLLRYNTRLQKLKVRRKNETLDLEISDLTQKYQKDIISSVDNLQLILKNTDKNEPKLVERFEKNVQEYFHSQKEELEEKIKVVKEQEVNTLQRNPKEIPFLGGIYLFITVVSYLAYTIAYVVVELCQVLNDDNCVCAPHRHVVEIVKLIVLIVDLVPTSIIIQFLLRYDSLFGDTVELNVRNTGE